jgi:hypothetical protein
VLTNTVGTSEGAPSARLAGCSEVGIEVLATARAVIAEEEDVVDRVVDRFSTDNVGGFAESDSLVAMLSGGDPGSVTATDPAAISLLSTESTIVLRTFFLVISFLRSARAASVTPGAVKISTTEFRAQSRTVPSLSSRASTSCER